MGVTNIFEHKYVYTALIISRQICRSSINLRILNTYNQIGCITLYAHQLQRKWQLLSIRLLETFDLEGKQCHLNAVLTHIFYYGLGWIFFCCLLVVSTYFFSYFLLYLFSNLLLRIMEYMWQHSTDRGNISVTYFICHISFAS